MFKKLAILIAVFAFTESAFASGIIVSSGSILDVNAGILMVSGDFINAGTLAGNGTVAFTGGAGATQNIIGSSSFYNLTCTAGGTQLNFEAGKTQTVRGALTLTGQADSNIALRSSSAGTQWKIDPQGSRQVRRVDVKDSNNINATAIAAANSTDSGNNINWFIYPTGPDDVPPIVSVKSPNGGEAIEGGSTYNITWTATDEGSGLEANPITLRSSTNGGSDWEIITGEVENTGAYAWSVPKVSSTLTTCLIGVDARDKAGNIGNDQSDNNFTIIAAPAFGPAPGLSRGKGATIYLSFELKERKSVTIQIWEGTTPLVTKTLAVDPGWNQVDLFSEISDSSLRRGNEYTVIIQVEGEPPQKPRSFIY